MVTLPLAGRVGARSATGWGSKEWLIRMPGGCEATLQMLNEDYGQICVC